jgi:hypothetical protein
LVKDKAIDPLPEQVEGFEGVAERVGELGAVSDVFTPKGEVHPFAVICKLLKVPAGTLDMLAVLLFTTTPVKEPPV